MSERTKTSATVTVTFEVQLNDRWGNDCTLDQVYRQAVDGAIGMLHNPNAIREAVQQNRLRVIGKPKVVAVTSIDVSDRPDE